MEAFSQLMLPLSDDSSLCQVDINLVSTASLKLPCVLSFQGSRQRQIIYRVTSQQDSSVLQVISGPETSVQEEMSLDAMHVFIDEHGES